MNFIFERNFTEDNKKFYFLISPRQCPKNKNLVNKRTGSLNFGMATARHCQQCLRRSGGSKTDSADVHHGTSDGNFSAGKTQ